MEFVEAGINIAKEAGTMLLNHIDKPIKIDQKESEFDLVTEWDKKIEEYIVKEIKEAFPDHIVVGEEGFNNNFKSVSLSNLINENEHVWVIDPIDGTNNYIHGLPGYTISIAKFQKGEIRAGVVYSPDNNELFSAEKGRGAYLNGTKINVSKKERLEESIIATGIPSNIEIHRKNVLNQINMIGTKCRNIRIYGSAALHCAYTAAGRLEAYWEPGLNIWDIAAGVLIATEAGGMVSELDGSPFAIDFDTFLVSNGGVGHQIIRVLE